MDAANQPPRPVVVRPLEDAACKKREEADMRNEVRHQSPALRCTEISEEFFETLCSIANDPNPKSGIVDWTPKGVPIRKLEPAKS